MASNQLIMYAPGNDPTQYQPGQFTPAAKLAASRHEADTLAAQLHAPAPLELDLAVSVNVPAQGQPTENQSGALVSLHGPGVGGRMYVATPALLKAFGISASAGEPGRRRAHRARRDCRRRAASRWSAAASSPSRRPGAPPGRASSTRSSRRSASCRPAPPLPNTVITEQAVRALHETIVPVGWLVQAPAALTPVQINAARQAAVALGTTIETKFGQLGLGQISDGATVGGILDRARRAGHDRRPDPLRDRQRPAHAHRDGGGLAHQAGAHRRHRGRDRAARRGARHCGRASWPRSRGRTRASRRRSATCRGPMSGCWSSACRWSAPRPAGCSAAARRPRSPVSPWSNR